MPIIPKRNLHVKPFNPAMLENNQYHRNMSILKPECWVILVLAIVLLIAGVVHTLASFTPRVEAIQASQASMADEIRTLQSEQAEIRRAVEAWPGITQAAATEPTTAATTTATLTSRSAEAVRETAAMTETVQPTTTETTLDRNNYDPDLVRIVALEADHTYEGALGVASVIYNRLADGRWGDTILDVITAPGQFCWDSKRLVVITDNDLRACQDAAAGIRNLPDDVLWFCTPAAYSRSSWFRSLEIVDRFGGHVWCREAGK